MRLLLFVLMAITLVMPEFTEARRGGGFRSSSRSYSTRSYSKPSRTKTRSYSGSKSTSRSYSKTKSKIATKQAKVKSRLALNKFKAKSKPAPSYKSVKKSNPVIKKYSSTTSYSRLKTYDSRRVNFYSSYTPPRYVYNSAPSFGVYDAMFLWMMLDRPSYHSTYYHHQNDAGFKEWRKEAEKQAATNAELKAKLEKLDAEMKNMKGTKVDPEFVPKNVDADIMLSKDIVDGMKKDKKEWWML